MSKTDVQRQVRQLLRTARKAVLSTVDPEGHPYASLHAVATAQDGSPILLFSDLSQHTRNARSEPRAALLVENAYEAAKQNPQEIARACISGSLAPVDDPQLAARYLRLHPAAQMYAGFGDFHFFKMTIQKARYVGGFAQAASVSDALCIDAELTQQLAAAEASILQHMNEDHADALRHYASQIGEADFAWQMAGLDADGFDLIFEGHVSRFPFDEPLTSVDQVRSVLVDLAQR